MIYYSFQVNDSLTAPQNPAGETTTNFRITFSNLGITLIKYIRIDGARVVVSTGSTRCDAYVELLYFNNDPAIVPPAPVTNVSPGAIVLNGLYLTVDAYKELHIPEGVPIGSGKALVVQVTFYGFTPAVAVSTLQCGVTLGIDNAPTLKSDVLKPEVIWMKEKERVTISVKNPTREEPTA
jgi:hypothetical protein